MLALFFFLSSTNAKAQNYALSEGIDVGIGGGIVNIELVDLNQDGKADQIIQNTLGQVWVSYSLFGGYYSTPTVIYDVETNITEFYIEIYDLNNDQLPDIVFNKYQNLYWLENKKDHFQTPQKLCADCVEIVNMQPLNIKVWTLADINNDQEVDVLTVKYSPNSVYMDFFCSYNLGSLTFDPPISLGIQQVYAYSDVRNIKVKDFNQDEIPEIFFFDGLLSGTLYMAQKNTTTAAWTIEQKANNVIAYNFIDSNNDGVDEIVSLSTSGSVRIHDQTGELLMTKQAHCYAMTNLPSLFFQ